MTDFDPVGEWLAAFPHVEITPGAAGEIEADVKPEDAEAWRATIKKYRLTWNPARPHIYDPGKFGNVLGVFTSIKEKNNGAYRPISGLSIREARELGAFDDYERRKRLERELFEEDVRNSQPLLRGCDASAD